MRLNAYKRAAWVHQTGGKRKVVGRVHRRSTARRVVIWKVQR